MANQDIPTSGTSDQPMGPQIDASGVPGGLPQQAPPQLVPPQGSPVLGPQMRPPQQQPQQQAQGPTPDQVKHYGIGKAFSTIVGNNKPGQLFRGILAGALMGGAAADGAGGPIAGFAKGGNAVIQDQRAQKQLAMENQQKQQKAQQEQVAADDAHTWHQSQVAASHLGQIRTQQEIDKFNEDEAGKIDAANHVMDTYYQSLPLAQPAQFTVNGKTSGEITVGDMVKANDPTLMHPTDAKNFERHFVILQPKGGEESVKFNGDHWEDEKTGQPVDLALNSKMHAYDIPTNTFGKPSMVSAKDMQAIDPAHKDQYKDGQQYARTPEQMGALQDQTNKQTMNQAELRLKKAEALEHEAKAQKDRNSVVNPSSQDVMDKYHIPPGATGAQVLSSLPKGLATAIDKVAHYEWDSHTFNTWIRNNAQGMPRQEAMTLASMVNPNYKEEMYKTVQNTLNNYNDSKKEGGQIDAFNKFLGHAAEAADVTSQWRTTNTPLLNTPLNKIKDQLKGDPNYTHFITALAPVRKEYMSFLNQNRAEHEGDIDLMKTVLSDSASPAQIERALKDLAGTAVTQLRVLNERFKTTTDTSGVPNIIQPYSRRAIQRLSDKNPKTGAGRDLNQETEDMNTGGTYHNLARAGNQSQSQSQNQTPPPSSTPPPGATMKVPGPDGMHWSDGKKDLGLIQEAH